MHHHLSSLCISSCVQVFQQELPEAIQDTWDHLTEVPERVPESRWHYTSPKSLLDNFCRTMHCLFSECFSSTEVQQDCKYDKKTCDTVQWSCSNIQTCSVFLLECIYWHTSSPECVWTLSKEECANKILTISYNGWKITTIKWDKKTIQRVRVGAVRIGDCFGRMLRKQEESTSSWLLLSVFVLILPEMCLRCIFCSGTYS